MRWLVGVLVGVLVLVTAGLAFAAVERNRSSGDGGTPDPVPSFSIGPPRTASPSPAPSSSLSPSSSPRTPAPAASRGASTSAPTAAADQRFLSIGSGVLWRATAGSCAPAAPAAPVAPVIERSADGGASWTDVTPTYRGIREVISLDAFAQVQAEAIASMGANCETQALRTFTQGRFWESYPDVLRQSRYLAPASSGSASASPGSVVTPAGRVAAPCAEPRSFRASGQIVALVCDGVAHRLVDGRWVALGAADVAALAIADGTVLTASTTAGCSGVEVTRWSGADFGTSASLGCAEGANAAAPLAVAGTGTSATVWSGDALISLPR